MNRLWLSVCVGVVLGSILAAPARAQEDLLRACAQVRATSPQGTVPDDVQDQFRFLCGQAVQAISTIQPIVGVAFSGGAHTLGTATTLGLRLGMIPRISVTARVNAALADVPDLLDGYVPRFDDDGQLRPMGTVGVPVGALQGDVTLGVFDGLRLVPGIGGLGAVDLLGSASVVPSVSAIGLADPIVNVGLGARVGILRQSLILPGVSVSGMYRTMLGDVSFGELGGDPASGDPAEFTAGLSSWSFRAGVSKGVLLLDLAAGLGYDIYQSDVHFDWRLLCPQEVCGQELVVETENGVQGRLRTAAWNAYGNVGLSFVLVRIVAEIGYQRPTDIVGLGDLRASGLPDQPPVVEDLSGGRFFLSLGARLSL